MRKSVTVALLTSLALLSACNTVEGVGKDIQKAGEAIQGAGESGKK